MSGFKDHYAGKSYYLGDDIVVRSSVCPRLISDGGESFGRDICSI